MGWNPYLFVDFSWGKCNGAVFGNRRLRVKMGLDRGGVGALVP